MDMLRRSGNAETPTWSRSSSRSAGAGGSSWRCAGVVLVAGLVVAALIGAAFGLESWRFSPGSIVTFRVLLSIAVAATDRLVLRAAAAAARHRRAGRALSRRARAVAAGGDHQRRRGGGAQPPLRRTTVGARPSARRVGGREGPGDRARPPSRAGAVSPLRGRVRGDRHRGHCALHARSRLPAPRPVGAAHRLAQRRGGGAVPDRSHAGQRQRAARRRPDRSPRR